MTSRQNVTPVLVNVVGNCIMSGSRRRKLLGDKAAFMRKLTFGARFLFFGFLLNACGGSSTGTLQSIKINQQMAVAFPEFNATGIYSSGRQVTPLSVGWFDFPLNSFLVANPHYTLTKSAFLPQCTAGVALTVMTIAPIDANASTSGTIPASVFQDFATGKTNNEGGFLAATAQLNCP
jgi:hypothetical protein